MVTLVNSAVLQVREGHHGRGQAEGDDGGAQLPRHGTAGGGPPATGIS